MSAPTAMVLTVDSSLAFAASPMPQALLDPAWRITTTNPAWTGLLGGGTGTAWFNLLHPADLARDLVAAGQLQTGGQAHLESTLRLAIAGGGWLTARVILTALGGGSLGFLATVFPGPTAVPEERASSTESADDGRLLAAALAHDVRQHARLISAYASLLGRSALEERQQGHLAVITDHAERLHGVLDGLVRWLRLADGVMDRQACDLAQLWAAANSGEAVADTLEPLPVLVGDPQLLGELLGELVRNAQRYHPKHAQLSLSATRAAQGWELRVSDDGPGIPSEHRERVLLPLNRLHTWEQVAGHGMGLSIARRIAQRHGGDLTIVDGLGGMGCTVVIRLPD